MKAIISVSLERYSHRYGLLKRKLMSGQLLKCRYGFGIPTTYLRFQWLCCCSRCPKALNAFGSYNFQARALSAPQQRG
eukprot:2168535-Amphidinium_carterae.2